jgi:hypothetical protein
MAYSIAIIIPSDAIIWQIVIIIVIVIKIAIIIVIIIITPDNIVGVAVALWTLS